MASESHAYILAAPVGPKDHPEWLVYDTFLTAADASACGRSLDLGGLWRVIHDPVAAALIQGREVTAHILKGTDHVYDLALIHRKWATDDLFREATGANDGR